MLRTQPAHVVPEACDRPRPADPLGAQRGRISDAPFNNSRTRGSNGVNAVGTARRSNFGGRSEASRLLTYEP